MFPSVMYAVTGRHFQRKEAVLSRFARFAVRGEVYPGIVEREGASTDGILYFDVDVCSLSRLDDFEGDLYRRISVEVKDTGGGQFAAFAYEIKPWKADRLSGAVWDVREFEGHLDYFIKHYEGFLTVRSDKRKRPEESLG